MLKIPSGIYYMPKFLNRELSKFSAIELADKRLTYVIFKHNKGYRFSTICNNNPLSHEDYKSLEDVFFNNPYLYRSCKIMEKEL